MLGWYMAADPEDWAAAQWDGGCDGILELMA